MSHARQPRLSPAEARLTAERQETKYVLGWDNIRALVRELAARLPSHEYRGEGANRLPKPRHYVTTVYFDTAQRDLYRAAVSSESNLKLRAKEYYDLHPHLVETATDFRQLVRPQTILWLEIKHKDGTLSGKRRFAIPKRDVPGFFGQGIITPQMVRVLRTVFGDEAQQVLREVKGLCSTFSEPLRADCLVNYHRTSWQDEAGTLRVTVDQGIGFFSPPDDLWQRDHALVRETLGKPRAVEVECVLEIKARGPHPLWLDTLLSAAGAERVRYSKFVTASEAVNG